MSDATVNAKTELTLQLIDMITEHLYSGIKSIFDKTKEEGVNTVLKRFQVKLLSIPIWNQQIIDKEFERIISNKDAEHLDKLLDMLFVSHVKVLSVLKINENNKVNIQVPNAKVFIHKCYIECARAFYRDPYLIDDRVKNYDYSEIQRNIKRSHAVINQSIEKTVRDLIPLKDILEAYSASLAEPENVEQEIENVENEINDIESDHDKGSDHESDRAHGNHFEEHNEQQENFGDNEQQENFRENEQPENYIDKAFTMQPPPQLNVTSGEEISETPHIEPYSQNQFPNQFQTHDEMNGMNNENHDEPQHHVEEIGDGIKNILIQGKQSNVSNTQRNLNGMQNVNSHRDNDNFFSDDED
jgi:Family of unknown function (DUF5764)